MGLAGLRRAFGAALTAFLGAALLAGSPVRAPASGENSLSPGFYFQVLAGEPGGGIERVCGATFLDDKIAVTARHCLVAAAEPVRLVCPTGDSGPAFAETQLEQVVSHPTHDIALFRIASAAGCSAPEEAPVLEAAADGPYRAWTMAPAPPSTRRSDWTRSQLAFSKLDRDGPVIRTRIQRDCPIRGDSGTGLFSLHQRPPVLQGLLIGGAPDCPGLFVFLRLAPLKSWIEEHAALLAEDPDR